MSSILVLYQSKYGATKKYAEWLSQALSCDMVETKAATIEQAAKYDVIILGGGVYATGVAGISFLKKNYEKLKTKKIVVFAVGASPFDEKAVDEIRNKNMKNELSQLPFYYCRGAWNEEIMSWKDRAMCNLLKKAVAKKDPSTYEPWESALMQAPTGESCDWTDKSSLVPIIENVRG